MLTIKDIGAVLAKCSAYDPSHFAKPSQAVAEAWLEHFDQFPSLTRELVLEAVKVYYRTPDRKVPQPGDLSRVARDLWQDSFEREDADGPLHRALERRAEAKALDEALALPMVNESPAVVAARRQAIEAFEFRPKAQQVEHCRFGCGPLKRSPSGLWVHQDGSAWCPNAPREGAELSQDGLEAPPEGEGAEEGSPTALEARVEQQHRT